MGLDQHAHLRGQKVDWDKYYSDDQEEQSKVFVWRKHARLQQFMAKKWDEQNAHHEHDGMLSHLGFNSDCDAPVYITQEVAKELAEQIQEGFKDYPSRRWIFLGATVSRGECQRVQGTRYKVLKVLRTSYQR